MILFENDDYTQERYLLFSLEKLLFEYLLIWVQYHESPTFSFSYFVMICFDNYGVLLQKGEKKVICRGSFSLLITTKKGFCVNISDSLLTSETIIDK